MSTEFWLTVGTIWETVFVPQNALKNIVWHGDQLQTIGKIRLGRPCTYCYLKSNSFKNLLI